MRLLLTKICGSCRLLRLSILYEKEFHFKWPDFLTERSRNLDTVRTA
ncbi:hypothetical protein DWUX_498 [Desulfovibrio diazotrophicus]|nr:hypothetical protein DWUX_498 [Desulfovibrio diazotrophicus]VVU42816.1 hypothetical protein DWUX_162 [Desulfovibrio diazotrophicus]